MCGSTREATVNHHLGHSSYVFSSRVALAMREDPVAKDDYPEAERPTVWLGSLVCWPVPSNEWISMQCAMHAARLPATSMLLSGSDCLVLAWGGGGVEQNNPRTVLP
jgi:hypothetical protein